MMITWHVLDHLFSLIHLMFTKHILWDGCYLDTGITLIRKMKLLSTQLFFSMVKILTLAVIPTKSWNDVYVVLQQQFPLGFNFSPQGDMEQYLVTYLIVTTGENDTGNC